MDYKWIQLYKTERITIMDFKRVFAFVQKTILNIIKTKPKNIEEVKARVKENMKE